ncbi:MAG: hypothetical protein WCX74_00255 [Candidatus Paceibacterota bacterium]
MNRDNKKIFKQEKSSISTKFSNFKKKHPFISSIFSIIITIFLGIIIIPISSIFGLDSSKQFASLSDTTRSMDKKIDNINNNLVNNEDCVPSFKNQWISINEIITINDDNILFKYKEGLAGGEIEYINPIDFSDSKEIILEFSLKSINLSENDTIIILLKNEIRNSILKIEVSKMRINFFEKKAEKWISIRSIRYDKKIDDFPLFYFKLSVSRDGNRFRLSTIPRHKNYLDNNASFISEIPVDINTALEDMGNMNKLRLGLALLTSSKHDIEVGIQNCEIRK